MIYTKRLSATRSVRDGAEAASPSNTATSSVHPARQASNIIVSTLSDQALRVVRAVVGKPVMMLAELDQRYDPKSTATRISKMSELASML